MMSSETIMCPVCGGAIQTVSPDKVNRCEFCASPVLGRRQNHDCVNHPGRVAKGVCSVCGDLVCEECIQLRVGDYGGKLFTIANCGKPDCVQESKWAQPLNLEYQRLANMDWSDSVDNSILRVTGLGAVLMVVFELVFVLCMLYVQYFTSWGLTTDPVPNIPYFFVRGDTVVLFCIIGNLLSALLLQTALQVHVHERQLGAGILLMLLLVTEVGFLLGRGLLFNLRFYPSLYLIPFFLGAFVIATLMVFGGALLAIGVGFKKRKQLKRARETLGLSGQ
ncbi:MAG: hypothetical protein C4K49_06275 [Candidatus Thorarchaeota archaeon]|nr:MAG: hypothetical protein C4K49_06275 [Candidatus Thorarchaeota archaeon]